MPPISPQLVQEKLLQLNSTGNHGAPFWIEATGLRALTELKNENGNISFNPTNGIPIKVFTNTQTGEIKIFDARAFINQKN